MRSNYIRRAANLITSGGERFNYIRRAARLKGLPQRSTPKVYHKGLPQRFTPKVYPGGKKTQLHPEGQRLNYTRRQKTQLHPEGQRFNYIWPHVIEALALAGLNM